MISCYLGMPDSELLGRSIPNIQTGENVYHPSDFVRCYENGGVFLLDEVDAGDANILLRINAAIANGVLAVPARTGNPYARKHPLFVLLFAANTFGTGADRRYVGRNQLDEATLDRVRATTVPVGYAEEVEKRLCPNDKVYGLLTGFRQKVFDNSLERIVSTRLLAKAYKLVCQARACSMAELLASLFGGWTDEEMTLVLGEPFSPKKWAGWEP
jgi:cobaltochelatase CobS